MWRLLIGRQWAASLFLLRELRENNAQEMTSNRFALYWKKLLDRLCRIKGTPRHIAAGFALGIFVGMTPFLGLHIVIAVFLATVLNWSKIGAFLGVQITNVVTAPFFYGFTYWVGSKIVGSGRIFEIPAAFSLETLWHLLQTAPSVLWALIIGGAIIGLPLSFMAYCMVYFLYEHFIFRCPANFAEREKGAVLEKERRGETAAH